MAEVGSRGFVVGIGGMLTSALTLGVAYRIVANSNPEIPKELIGNHIIDKADFSLPISAEDVAASAALGVAGSFVVSIVSIILQEVFRKHYRW